MGQFLVKGDDGATLAQPEGEHSQGRPAPPTETP